ncbi:MAG: endolytic transglycosylase MltG, partial [Firmicutes bacterium]|nr:endolytic transglycosylase MltG [Bacillota bacterium]
GSGRMAEREFMKAVKNNRSFALFDKSIPENLEGYLFPETYHIWRNIKPVEFIAMMVSEFNREVEPLYEKNKKSLKLKISEIITLASLIEREAKVPRERPVIAAVYYNRLKEGMLLECDATIQYILGDSKENLTYADLKINSPYNTYLYKGLNLPVKLNPGLDSIKAAMEPEKVNYLFYVLNSLKNDGSHVFSRDYSQHLENVRKYLR